MEKWSLTTSWFSRHCVIRQLLHSPFLTRNIEALRHEPVDIMPRTKTVKSDWDTCRGALPNPAAVKDLVELLGIRQLREAPFLSGTGFAAGSPCGGTDRLFRSNSL